jgi:integrase
MLRKIMHGMRKRKLLTDVPSMPFEKEVLLRLEFGEEAQSAFLAAFSDQDGFMAYLAENRVYGDAKTCTRYPAPRPFGASLKPDSDAARVYFTRFSESRLWFLVALHTGLRRGDVSNLRWPSINFRENFIRVVVQKTGREATVPISATLRAALLEAKARPVFSEYAIVNADGHRYADGIINRYHRTALAIAGIKRRVRVHDLRHSLGSALASAGASELMLKDFFGHESTRMVQRYSRPSQQP